MKRPSVSRWVHLPLLMFAAMALAPLAFMLTTALSEPGRTLRAEVSLLPMLMPRTWHWNNFIEVWGKVPFMRYYLNSLMISLAITSGQVLTSAMAAYAFARLNWPGRDRLFLAYLATLMIPGAVTMIPNFILMKSLPEIFGKCLPFESIKVDEGPLQRWPL
ncbi:MAG: carbohydrate ABC transporter permease, partial [Verrucomicrobia bacterium]|nr:carbohydrate ABC transporter permease [Verrucomicrobiota bacterium]